jgi:hypothetical protein
MDEKVALEKGLQEKAEEFKQSGSELYVRS